MSSELATRRVPTLSWIALALVGGVLVCLSGCKDRSIGHGTTERECWDLWECNPGRLCGEMIDCQDFRCTTDASPVVVPCPADECLRDSDCLVAQPFDCCNGCPEVARRVDLESDPDLRCFYEQGTTAPSPPPECLIDCYACPLCFPQPLAARCDLGRCAPVDRGCPSTRPEPPTRLTVVQLLASPEAYDGQEVRVAGTLLPAGPMACADGCTGPRCCYASMSIDGAILLEGNPCALQLGFWMANGCEDKMESEGMLAGGAYEVWGTARLTGQTYRPLILEVVGLRLRDAASEGMAGAFDVTVTQIQSDASDPGCRPPSLRLGAPGRVYLAEAGGMVRAWAPMFDCNTDFTGTAQGGVTFDSRVPIYCDDCCCDFLLGGEVTASRIFGSYTSFDGLCRHHYFFEGARDPLPHRDP